MSEVFKILTIREWTYAAELVRESQVMTVKSFDVAAEEVFVVAVATNIPVTQKAPSGRVRLTVDYRTVFDLPVGAISNASYAREYLRLRQGVRGVLASYDIAIPELTDVTPWALTQQIVLPGDVDRDERDERFVAALHELLNAAQDRSLLWNLDIPIHLRSDNRLVVDLTGDVTDVESVVLHAYVARPVS
jgi:hypothetical protein